MSIESLGSLKPLLIRCVEFAPLKVLTALTLILLSSVASGAGILLIVPLLGSVGVDMGNGGSSSGVAQSINSVATNLGLELNLQSVLVVYLLLMIIVASLSFASTVVSASLRQSFVMQLRNELSRALFYTQWKYLNRQHMSDFLRLLTSQVQSVGASLQLLLNLTSSVILVLVYVGLASVLSAKLTVIAVFCALGLALLLWPINRRIHASGRVGLNANQNIYRSIFDNIGSLKIIKSFAAEERYLDRIESTSTELEQQQIRMAKFNALTRWVNMVGATIIFTVLFYSAIQWFELPIANLLAMLFIFSRLMPQVSSIQSTIQNLIHQAPTYQDLMARSADLKQWSEVCDSTSQSGAPRLNQSIVLKDLSYQYMDSQNSVFNGLNATFKRNQTVAIVGPSGVGKSTLADLISGLLEPSGGHISVDGCAIDDSNRLAWRSRVAYVTQEVFLFHESVRDNLSWVCAPEQFVNNQVPDSELWNALALAAADGFVKALPQGLDTLVGDRGVKLSGGERQRLVLARALISKPDILILDEATSALDRENELKIRDALVALDGKLTIIIIAHNETTIEHVSQRIELGLV
jgi:ATP-binding cassette subfamily C protein